MRVERIGDATLYLGDCREAMIGLQFDAVLTDPPYGINHSSSRGASWQSTRIAGDNDTSLRDVVLRSIDTVAAFGTWKTPPIEGTHTCLVFDKGPAFGMGDLSVPWKPSWELIYIKGHAWSGTRDEGVLRGHMQVSWETQSKGLGQREARSHPHQKPVSLMAALLNKLPHHFVILDPFMGSGTTGLSCIKTGRPFVGIELDVNHYETALRRIEAAQRQGDMFVRATPRAVTPDMFGTS